MNTAMALVLSMISAQAHCSLARGQCMAPAEPPQKTAAETSSCGYCEAPEEPAAPPAEEASCCGAADAATVASNDLPKLQSWLIALIHYTTVWGWLDFEAAAGIAQARGAGPPVADPLLTVVLRYSLPKHAPPLCG